MKTTNPILRRPFSGAVFVGAALLIAAIASETPVQAQYSYTTLNTPGSPTGISGQTVVGSDFVYNIGSGTYTTLDVPGSTFTSPQGIDGNNVVGNYGTSGGNTYGFLYTSGIGYTTLSLGAYGTQANAVSGDTVVGFYYNNGNDAVGFLYNFNTESYTSFGVPGAVDTYPWGISGNNVVGNYENGGGNSEAFLYNTATGSLTILNAPGASHTSAFGISGNDVVGTCTIGGVTYGFFYNGSAYSILSVPGANFTQATAINGTNIVGYYQAGNGNIYGYLATAATGPAITTEPQSQFVYQGNPASFTVSATGTPPLSYQWQFDGTNLTDGGNVAGSATSNLIINPVDQMNGGNYTVIVTNNFGSVTSIVAMLTVVLPPEDSGNVVYLRTETDEPWNSPANDGILTMVFGAGWQTDYYETVNPSALFSPANKFIFMEGSADGEPAMATFLSDNLAALTNWVAGGGSLFLDAAPFFSTEYSLNVGFGVTLNVGDYSTTGGAAIPGHPIFQGPYTPVGDSWNGDYFAHSTVSGPGLTTIITNTADGNAVLAERFYGLGHLMFGGMTLPPFQSPNPQATNLWANILSYSAGLVSAGPAVTNVSGFGGSWTLNSTAGAPAGISGNVLTLTTVAGGHNSAIYDIPQPIGGDFSAKFVWDITDNNGGNPADGFAFVIENEGINAIAADTEYGSDLAYETEFDGPGITNSVAVGIENYLGFGYPVLELGINGNFTQVVNLNGSGINIYAQDNPIQINVSFESTSNILATTLVQGTNTFAYDFQLGGSISSLVGSSTAYVGFSGATGAYVESQTISNFSFALGLGGNKTNGPAPINRYIQPTIQTPAASPGQFAFSWNNLPAYPSVDYQVQYTTNLASRVWVNVGPIITNSSAHFTTPIGIDSQRFYRVELVQGISSNLLANSGFETQGGWILFNGAQYSQNYAHSGSWSMLDAASDGVPGCYQQFPASPGMKFEMTGYGFTPTPLTGGTAYGILQITYFDSNNNNLGTVETSPGNALTSQELNGSTPAGVWSFLDTGVATAPPNTAYVQAFTLYVGFSGTDEGVYFDDISLLQLN